MSIRKQVKAAVLRQRAVEIVDDDNFVSYSGALQILKISEFRMRILVSNGHLKVCTRKDGTEGLVRESVMTQLSFQAEASWPRRLSRLIVSIIKSL